MERDLGSLQANSAKLFVDTIGLVIGGSKAKGLVGAVADMGKSELHNVRRLDHHQGVGGCPHPGAASQAQ
jgi:hypothetical protein